MREFVVELDRVSNDKNFRKVIAFYGPACYRAVYVGVNEDNPLFGKDLREQLKIHNDVDFCGHMTKSADPENKWWFFGFACDRFQVDAPDFETGDKLFTDNIEYPNYKKHYTAKLAEANAEGTPKDYEFCLKESNKLVSQLKKLIDKGIELE